ncbi:hypothetical protein BBJ28_00023131, partial [Nothophytophthora sp. Chile5]
YAGLLMAANVIVVLCGMQAGKLVVNLVTMTKISVVSFIIVVGLLNFDAANITPFIPEQTVVVEEGGTTQSVAFGWPGVLLGASASFYGYIGYDEVCCLAGEAKDPARNIPRAVVGTILGAATLSILATFALVGMQRYTEIDAGESYGNAFSSVGMDWAASFVVTGEVLTMPITSFIGFLAQPRVQYAMAKDGLLPAVFAKVDANGNLFHGTLICGVAVTILAVFVPFHVLWNFISLGILVAFNLTNSSLLFVRASSGSNRSEGEQQATNDGAMRSQGWLIAGYLATSFLAAFHWQKSVVTSVPLSSTSLFDRYMQTAGPIVAALFTLLAIGLMFALSEAEKKQTVHSSPATTKTKTRAQDGPVEIVLASKKEEQAMAGRVGCLQRRRSADRGDDELHTPEGEDDEVERHEVLSESTSRLENGRRTATDSDEEDEPDSAKREEEADAESSTFRAPFVPFAPCTAIFFNWFLFAQMDGASVLLILLWLLLALAFGGVLVTPEQIHQAFEFLDVDHKGRITLENLRSRLGIFYDSMSLKDVRLLLSEETELTEEYLHALLLPNEVKNFDPVAEAFKAYDPEETGFISREMLRYVFERLGYGALTEEDLDVLISCADADRDGRINLADFRAMLE